MAGKVAVVCGYGDVGKGSAAFERELAVGSLLPKSTPICALQAAMDGFAVKRLEKMPWQKLIS